MPNAEQQPFAPQAETFGVQKTDGSAPPIQTDTMEYCRRQLTSFVREQPITAVMTLFGVGLGAGLLAAQLIAQPESRSRTQQLADRISRTVRDALPASLR